MKTVEHKSESRNNHQFAAVVQDLTIQWILRRRIYERFLEPSQKPKVIDMNQLLELSKSCQELSWNHHFIAQKQDIAERAVSRVKKGHQPYYRNLD